MSKCFVFGMDFISWLRELESNLLQSCSQVDLHEYVPCFLGPEAFSVYHYGIPSKAKKEYVLLRRELLLRFSSLTASEQEMEARRFQCESKQLEAAEALAAAQAAEALAAATAAQVCAAEKARKAQAVVAGAEAVKATEAAEVPVRMAEASTAQREE